jgi:hypothetical protein
VTHRGRLASVAALGLALALCFPEVAHACPVCFDPRDENRFAFLGTTIFMSLLPLGLVAGMVTWVRHRSRKLDEEPLPPPDDPAT